MAAIISQNKAYVTKFEHMINKTENFIYYSTKGLMFNELLPEFQRIMKEEFLSKK